MAHDVLLVRHGAAAASWAESRDPGLSADGQAHATLVASALGDEKVCAIVSSPLARARETALPLAARWGLEVDIDERVREIPSRVAMHERRAWLDAVMAARWAELDDDIRQWRERARHAVLGYGRDTVVFTHFMVINALVADATGDTRVMCFEPDYGSITRLRCEGDRLTLVALGAVKRTLVNV